MCAVFILEKARTLSQHRNSVEVIFVAVTRVRVRVCRFPSLVPATATGNTGRRAWIVCNHTSRGEEKNTNTRYQCDVCNVGLCVIGCFGDYHTFKHF